MMELLGKEQYNKVKKWMDEPLAFAANHVPTFVQFGMELTSLYQSIAKPVGKIVKSAGNVAHAQKSLAAAKTAAANAKNPGLFRRFYNVGYQWYYKAPPVDTSAAQVMKAKETLENANKSLVSAQNATLTVDRALEVGAIGAIIATTVELSINTYRWSKGDIVAKEWFRKFGQCILRNSAVWVTTAATSAYATGSMGAAIGTALGGPLGTAIGSGTGMLTGMIIGFMT